MAVDHDQRSILGDRRILETIVHQDHGRGQRARQRNAVGTLARDHHRQRCRQHQRLVADIGGGVPLRIDPYRAVQSSTIAAAEHDRRFAEIAQEFRQRQHRRRLAGTADVVIADADDGHPGVDPRLLHPPCGDGAIECGERSQ
jgi:predicted RNA methylase